MEGKPLTPSVPGVVFCTAVVGGYWVMVVFFQMLWTGILLGIDVGKNPVALPVGRAMT